MPPFAPAVSARRLTSSLLSQLIASMTSLLSLGGMGRVVKVFHLSCVSSITRIVSDSTMQAAVSSVKRGSFVKPSASLQRMAAAISDTRRLTKMKIGGAQVRTQVTTAHIVCRLLLEKQKNKLQTYTK